MSAMISTLSTTPRPAPGIMVLAWFDSAAAPGPSVVALDRGEPIAPAAAYARLFANGRSGADRCFPWLHDRAARPASDVCAYAAIVGAPAGLGASAARLAGPRMCSGTAFSPTAEDRARLKREFQDFLRSELRSPSRFARELFVTPLQRDGAVEICVLSGEVRVSGVPVAISNAEFAVLVRLALCSAPQTRRELAEALWPDRDPDAAGNLLKVCVYRIRTRLGRHDVIEATNRGYKLAGDVALDLCEAEALVREAATTQSCAAADEPALRRAYAAFASRGYRRLSSVELFASLEARIEVLGSDLATLTAQAAWRGEDRERALAIADELLQTDPSCEAAVELAMRAHHAAGNRTAALARYRAFGELLRHDLDAAPSARLAELAAKLSS